MSAKPFIPSPQRQQITTTTTLRAPADSTTMGIVEVSTIKEFDDGRCLRLDVVKRSNSQG